MFAFFPKIPPVTDKRFAGIPGLGVLPIDPLRVAAISIGQGSGPVAVSLDFKDMDIYGLSEVQVDSVS